MKRPQEHVKENISKQIFHKKLPPAWILRDVEPDYGIDKSLEIVESEIVTGKEIFIQLKGTETPDIHDNYVSFSLSTANLKYYLKRDLPVLLIVVNLNDENCYWTFLQKYAFDFLNIKKPTWVDQKTVTIRIPIEQKVDETLEQIVEIAKSGSAYIFTRKPNQIPSNDHRIEGNRSIIKKKKKVITTSSKAAVNTNNKSYDFNSFDYAFKSLQQATEPKTKAFMMEEFQPKLRDLCYDTIWDDEVKLRVTKVLDFIPTNLTEDPNLDHHLPFLRLILHLNKPHIVDAIKEKFHDELEKLYYDYKFETNKQILSLLQKLHGYSEEYMMNLIDEAGSITKWSDQKFKIQGGDIQLWELRDRDKNAYDRILNHLRQKMNDAEKNNDDITYERLRRLYDLVKR